MPKKRKTKKKRNYAINWKHPSPYGGTGRSIIKTSSLKKAIKEFKKKSKKIHRQRTITHAWWYR